MSISCLREFKTVGELFDELSNYRRNQKIKVSVSFGCKSKRLPIKGVIGDTDGVVEILIHEEVK